MKDLHYFENDLAQGTEVQFNVGNITGRGSICGISSNGQPLIGKTYIIQVSSMWSSHVDGSIEGIIHEYTHITLPEIYLMLWPL